MIALVAAVAWLQWRQSALMSQTLLSSGDSLVRALYQADYEYLRLRQAWTNAAGAGDGSADAGDLQLRYDIFVSRVGLVRNATRTSAVGARVDVREALRQADAFIEAADRVLGPGRPPPDVEQIRALVPALRALEAPMRSLTLGAGEVVSESGTRLAEAGQLHNRLGIAATVLLAALAAVFAAFALRQLARERGRREQLEDLAAALKAARTAAEQASAAKSSFLANMSHEIRTPFMGLQGMLRLLGDTALDERQTRYLRTASASARHLLTLLGDILDTSRLEAGRMTIEAVPMDLVALLSDIESLMRPLAEGKGLRLHVEVHAAVPARVRADPTRLRQVLFNLMSNAIKFTERGEIMVRVSVEKQDAESALVRFSVSDTGIGIAPKDLGRLFRPFEQVDGSNTRIHGGSGLGLAICRRLAERMEGNVGATSEPGRGSIFWFAARLRLARRPA
ncbi:MAG: sensor histidine kinase, partial [Rubrivivax sp.]